jgi:hypothetical protein
VLLLAVAVAIGALAGLVRPPLGARTSRPRFSWLPLLGGGAVLNLAAYVLDGTAATFALMASLVLLLGFVGVNPHVTGVAVIGVGLLLNLVSVVLNDGMPVRGSALVAAGVVDDADLDRTTFVGARHLETSADTIPVLGDVLPVPLPIAPEVLSFGDLIVVVGAADAVRDLVRRRHRPARTADLAAPAPGLARAPGVDRGEPGPSAPTDPGPATTSHPWPTASTPSAAGWSPRVAEPVASGALADGATGADAGEGPPSRRRRFTGPGDRPLVGPRPASQIRPAAWAGGGAPR